MQNSKLQGLPLFELIDSAQEELPHYHCFCFHCINNTKPLCKLPAPRIISQKQKPMTSSKAFEMILRQMAKGYSGKCITPDVFFLSDSSLIFQGKNARPRLREKLSNIEVKKHIQQQRKKPQAFQNASQIGGSLISIMEDKSTLSFSLPTYKNSSREKESSLLVYHDGTEQLLTDSLLYKYLGKRKNDPLWEGVSHLLLIPPQAKQPLNKHRYSFIRSNDTLPKLETLLQKLAEQIDCTEEKQIVTGLTSRQEGKLSFLKQDSQEQMEYSALNNPQNKLLLSARKTKSVMFKKKIPAFLTEEIGPDVVKDLSLQLVAFIQLVTLNRILQAEFQYFEDGVKLYLVNVCNFIYQQLEGNELNTMHDRYKPLEEICLGDVVHQKQLYDRIEAQQLWRICANLVKENLEFRKVELKLENYKSPSMQTLLSIFMKIFPDFKAELVFNGPNWKNELGAFILSTRNKISQVIREDQGIRILRRFGLQFRRTFH